MSFLDFIRGGLPQAETARAVGTAFDAIGTDDIAPALFGLASYDDIDAGRISRAEAMKVAAVKRGRDLLVGPLSTLPIDLLDKNGQAATDFDVLLQQPEAGIPRSVTLARTFDDMVCHGVAWWLVTETAWHGYPTKVVRLDPSTVSIQKDGRVYRTKSGATGMAWEWVEDFDIIRFDSPNDPVLVAGARAIRAARALDKAALTYSQGNQPLDYFTPADGYDPEQEALDAAMDAWDAARAARSTGYVPGTLKYITAGWNPEQLQLADARQHAVLEIARVMGIDPEDLGVSTTSRTYFNAQDRKQARINDTLRAYAVAFEERLSMNDVTPRGYRARINFSDFLRSDDATRMTVAVQGAGAGILSTDQASAYFDPQTAVQIAAPAAAPTESEPADA